MEVCSGSHKVEVKGIFDGFPAARADEKGRISGGHYGHFPNAAAVGAADLQPPSVRPFSRQEIYPISDGNFAALLCLVNGLSSLSAPIFDAKLIRSIFNEVR